MHRLNEEVALSSLDSLVQVLDESSSSTHGYLVEDDARVHAVVDEKNRRSEILTPYARASRAPCMPATGGSSAGWELISRPP